MNIFPLNECKPKPLYIVQEEEESRRTRSFVVEFYNIRHVHLSSSNLQGSSCYPQNLVTGIELLH